MHKRYAVTILGAILISLFIASITASQQLALAQTASGTIAYVRSGGTSGDEIRLIEPDGSHDRTLWTVPVADPQDIFEIYALAWRPDGGELAFSSDHEQTCSIFAADLYAVRPDGSHFRRMGNGPACDTLATYPQGSVTVTVRNFTSQFETNFFVYVQGAPGIISVTLPWYGVATVTFPTVADFGAVNQQVAVLQTNARWYVGTVDVQAGQTVTTDPNPATASGDGVLDFGTWGPTWRSDGARIGYARSSSSCLNAYALAVENLSPVAQGEPILTADEISPCALAWGPTTAVADQVLFLAFPNLGMDGATLYRATEGTNASNGTKLFSLGQTVLPLWFAWQPDGAGLLFARTTKYVNPSFVEANLFAYDFASGAITQISQLSDELVRSFSISPDGQSIVFERAASLASADSDLWIMNRDGSGLRLLVKNGRLPSWGGQAAQAPTPTPVTPTGLPTVTPLPDATPTLQVSEQRKVYLPTIQR